MEKLERLNQTIASIKHSEGENFELNQVNLTQEIQKFEQQHASILIKILTILGGFLGSTFMVASFTTMFRINNNSYLLFGFGLLLVIVSVISSRFKKILIFDTSFVATLLWGSFLISLSLSQLKLDVKYISVYFLVIGIFILLVSKNSYQILISLLMMAGSLLGLIKLYQFTWLFHVYSFLIVFAIMQLILYEAKIIASKGFIATIYEPLTTGLIVILLISLGLISSKNERLFHVPQSWVSSIAPIAAILFFLQSILKKLEINQSSSIISIYAFCAIILALTALL